jgi:hypothetical protein
MSVPVDLSRVICKPSQNMKLEVDPMKPLIGIAAIAILFGIADATAEERMEGNNILPVAQKSAQNYSRQRFRQRYRRAGYHRSPYGGIVRRRGPYIQELGPAGPTGPIGRTIGGQ